MDFACEKIFAEKHRTSFCIMIVSFAKPIAIQNQYNLIRTKRETTAHK